MFVFLSKLLPLLVYPLGLACLLLILAIFLRTPNRLKNVVIGVALFLLCVGGNRWVAYSLTRSLETQYLPTETLPRAEVIVVLGGGTESSGPPRQMVEINGAGDRILYAANLYRQGAAPHILLSGGNITWLSSRPTTPAVEMEEILLFIGIPKEALWLQPESQNTYEDALYTAKILKERGIDQIILVTSAQHMPRSVRLFEAQGLEVIPAPADYDVPDFVWEGLWKADFATQFIYLFPTAGYLSMTTSSLKEYLGMLVYSLQGWL